MHTFTDVIKAALVVCGCSLLIQQAANAQSSRDRRKDDTPSAKELEDRLAKAEEQLVEEYKSVAIEYYTQGDKVKSMQMLKRLKQLSPKLDGLSERIDSISEELMQENSGQFDLDTKNNDWLQVGAVFKDKPFRIQSAGTYRMTMTVTSDIDGIITEEDAGDFHGNHKIGSLLAVIVSKGKGGKPTAGKPFPVGSQLEHIPREDGVLYLKMNVPNGTRCTGKIKIGVSGNIVHNLKD